MTLFASLIVTPPEHLPITVSDAQTELALAVTDELERQVMWRAIVAQTRRAEVDGPLPPRVDLEPTTSIVKLTRWTEEDAEEVVDAASYSVTTRDPGGTILAPLPGYAWPVPARQYGSFALDYTAGWTVTPETTVGAGDGVNEVPASVRAMIERAVAFRAGGAIAGFTLGSLKMSVADSYATDRLPRQLTDIARGWFYRPGIIAAAP